MAEPVACDLVEFSYDTTSHDGCRCIARTVETTEKADTSGYYHEYKAKSCNKGQRFHEESYTIARMDNFRKDTLLGDVIERVYVPDLKKYTARKKSLYLNEEKFETPRSSNELYNCLQLNYGADDAKYLLGGKK